MLHPSGGPLFSMVHEGLTATTGTRGTNPATTTRPRPDTQQQTLPETYAPFRTPRVDEVFEDQAQEPMEEASQEEEEEEEEGEEEEDIDDAEMDEEERNMEGPPQGSSVTILFGAKSIQPSVRYQSPRYIQGTLAWSGEKREVGSEATWTVSSAKPGNGAEQLRDNDTLTYWQSDSLAPHNVIVQFQRRATLVELGVFVDYHLDESYSPKKLIIKAGSMLEDLQIVAEAELNEPAGWIMIPLRSCRWDKNQSPVFDLPLKCFTLQIIVASMHQNGRDTHIRLIKLFGPRTAPVVGAPPGTSKLLDVPPSFNKSNGNGLGFERHTSFPSVR